MRLTRRWITLGLALTALLALVAPANAQAATQQLHWKFSRALSANQLDSTLVTLIPSVSDTLQFIPTDNLIATATAAIDTNIIAPHANLWLVVEVAGTNTNVDTLLIGMVGSMGGITPTGTSNGAFGNSGDQNNPLNWAQYTLLATTSVVTPTATGGKAWVFPIQCNTATFAGWVAHKDFALIVKGPAATTKLATSVRATLVSRSQ